MCNQSLSGRFASMQPHTATVFQSTFTVNGHHSYPVKYKRNLFLGGKTMLQEIIDKTGKAIDILNLKPLKKERERKISSVHIFCLRIKKLDKRFLTYLVFTRFYMVGKIDFGMMPHSENLVFLKLTSFFVNTYLHFLSQLHFLQYLLLEINVNIVFYRL